MAQLRLVSVSVSRGQRARNIIVKSVNAPCVR